MLRKLTSKIEYVWAVFAVVCAVKSILAYASTNPEDGLFFAGFTLVGLVMYIIRRTFRIKVQKSNEGSLK